MKLQEYIDLASRILNESDFDGKPQNLYNPLNYITKLGGKRIRPALSLLGYHIVKANWQEAVPLAKAVEYFHNFSLMHDDIMDKSPLRRGKEAVHVKWNEPTAILSGDLMLIKCYEELAKLKNWQIFNTFCQMAEEVCQGQQLDMDFESAKNITIKEYVEMVRLKTSVLIGKALSMGARLAGASKIAIVCLEKFGTHLGIGFQIMDDYLDTFGQSSKTGKRVGQDILDQKRSLPYLLAENTLDENGVNDFKNLFSTFEEEILVDKVRKFLIQRNIDQKTIKMAQEYFDLAQKELDSLEYSTGALRELLSFLKDRDF
ncbi:MAG: polyprenyl synthetase family protein [Bacteroidota bacterium]|nr:polyprenyl synthetase family protein [Bacteroidota bacterium]